MIMMKVVNLQEMSTWLVQRISIMKNRAKLVTSLLVISLVGQSCFTSASLAEQSNFFEQRYRGWLWFEPKREEEHEEEGKQKKEVEAQLPSLELMEQAKRENEAFSQELELLKNLMIRYPENLAYIKLYKQKEKEMMIRAVQLGKNWVLVNFLDPELSDELQDPQNIYGRDIKQQQREEEQQRLLIELAKEVELFIFRQEACPYVESLEKHLANFAGSYGFKVEAIAPDDSKSQYFKTYNSPALIKALELKTMPVVIAVVNKTRQRFELARGAVSVSELKNKALLLVKYLSLQAEGQEIEKEEIEEHRVKKPEAIIEAVPRLQIDLECLRSMSKGKQK